MLVELTTQSYFWLLCVVGLLLYYNYSRRKLYWLSWQLPGPNPALPLIGNCIEYVGVPVTDIVRLVDERVSTYSCGVVRFWLGNNLWVAVDDPGIAYQVNQKTLKKSVEYQYLMRPFADRSLFNTNDMPYWRQCRKAYLSGLSSDKLKSFVRIFHNEALRTMDTFEKYADRSQSVYTANIFAHYALSCLGRSTFDFDVHSKDEQENEDLLQSIHEILQFFQQRLFIPGFRFDFIYSLFGLRSKEMKHIESVFRYFKTIMDNHRTKKNRQSELENHVTESEEKPWIEYIMGPELGLTEEDILAHMFIMTMGGTDTVVTEYTVLLILLAQNPLVQQRVYEEVVYVLGEDFTICPSAEELNRLEYLDRVLKEAMRMFPPAPYIGRDVLEDFTVTTSDRKEYLIPVGATVVVLIRTIMNNERYYENPHLFDPDRWLPENVAKRPAHSFLPFSNGPRNCPGSRFAMLQMKTMVSTLVRAFEIQATESCAKIEDIRYQMSMTVHIDSSCHVLFRERCHGGKTKMGQLMRKDYALRNVRIGQ